jgi:hypothetical protein
MTGCTDASLIGTYVSETEGLHYPLEMPCPADYADY